MPRILCLHGHGTSSKIFETQLLGLRRNLPDDYELVFADGEVECDRAPGIPQAMPGPFLCYFNNFSFDDLRAAHELLQAIIDEEGPFDGVFAFSQGASLTLSYLLELERQEPSVNGPFKFAVLFSPTVALSPDCDFSTDIIESIDSNDFEFFAKVVDEATGSQHDAPSSAFEQQTSFFTEASICKYQSDPTVRHQVLVSSVGGILRAGVKTEFLSAAEFQDCIARQETAIVPRVFHPALLAERVRIPTVHITGSKDDSDLQSQFKVMPFLCQKESVKSVVHSGGHDLPRAPHEIKEVINAISWAVEEGNMPVF